MAQTEISVAQLKAAGLPALISARNSGNIPFPYRNLFKSGDRILSQENEPLIESFNKYRPRINETDFSFDFYNTREGLFVPSRFGSAPKLVRWDPDSEIGANILPILYTDFVRVNKAVKRKLSLTKAWKNDEVFSNLMNRIYDSGKETVRLDDFRIALIEDPNTEEPPCFKPTWVKALFEIIGKSDREFKSRSLLDLSANCGGVMIGAALMGVGQYVGFQPDTDYRTGSLAVNEGRDRILGLDGIASQLAPDKDFKVYYQDFDNELVKDQQFDIIMSSLPRYNELWDNPTIRDYPGYIEWLIGWLFQNLQASWLSLKENGYLILQLDDLDGYNLSEPMNLFIEQFLPGSSWAGSVGLEHEPPFDELTGKLSSIKGAISSVWIWQKLSGGLNTWGIDRQTSSLQIVYPTISESWISAYANGILRSQTGAAKERYESQLGIINTSLKKVISDSPIGIQRDQITILIRSAFRDPAALLPIYLSIGTKPFEQWVRGLIKLMTDNWNRPSS